LRNAASLQQIESFDRHHHRQSAQHGNVDVLPLPRMSSLVKGGEDADDAEQRRGEITDG
jgi:hypothetical protein